VGGPWIVQKGYGYPLDRPAIRMKEFLTIVKGAMSGEKFEYKGSFYDVKDIKMEKLTKTRPLVYMAGLNPSMLHVGGMIADGVIVNMFPLKALKYAREKIAEGAEKVGRDPKEVKLAVLASCGASADPEVLKQLKIGVAFYAHLDTHLDFLSSAGLEKEAKHLHSVWNKQGPDAAIESVDESLLSVLTLGYTPETIRKSAQEFVRNGVHPLIYPHFSKEAGTKLSQAKALIKGVAQK